MRDNLLVNNKNCIELDLPKHTCVGQLDECRVSPVINLSNWFREVII
jgi:hypothetical protein